MRYNLRRSRRKRYSRGELVEALIEGFEKMFLEPSALSRSMDNVVGIYIDGAVEDVYDALPQGASIEGYSGDWDCFEGECIPEGEASITGGLSQVSSDTYKLEIQVQPVVFYRVYVPSSVPVDVGRIKSFLKPTVDAVNTETENACVEGILKDLGSVVEEVGYHVADVEVKENFPVVWVDVMDRDEVKLIEIEIATQVYLDVYFEKTYR